MKLLKNILAIMAIALVSVLTACGQQVDEGKIAQAVASAHADGASEEASKADAKLSAAKRDMSRLAIETARKGGFSAAANCNVIPQGLVSRDFPGSAPSFYRDACEKEVATMNAERSHAKTRAVLAERQRVAKFAAAKARAERMAAAKKAANKQHMAQVTVRR